MLSLKDEFPYGDTSNHIVYEEEYKSHKIFVCSNNGWFPTAYIAVKENEKTHGVNYSNVPIEINNAVHGGFTYSENHLPGHKGDDSNEWYLGWDYAHCDDYNASVNETQTLWRGFGLGSLFLFDENPEFGEEDGKHWTIGEIVNEARAAVDAILEK